MFITIRVAALKPPKNVLAFRNPRAHDLAPDTPEYALECISFLVAPSSLTAMSFFKHGAAGLIGPKILSGDTLTEIASGHHRGDEDTKRRAGESAGPPV